MASLPSDPSSTDWAMIRLNKIIEFAVNLKGCKTVGDLVAAISTSNPDMFNTDDRSEYTFQSSTNNVNIPLNGPKYDPQAALPTINNPLLLIISKQPEQRFSIIIRQLGITDLASRPEDVILSVGRGDTVAQLKTQIQSRTGLRLAHQHLEFDGRHMPDQKRMLDLEIHKNCVVNVKQMVWVRFRFQNATKVRTSTSEELLNDALCRYSEDEKETLANLRFSIVKTTGRVTISRDWLPDRSELFEAEDVHGTLAENGLMNESEIQVYRIVVKRKRTKEVKSEDGEGRKRQNVRGTADANRCTLSQDDRRPSSIKVEQQD